MFCVTYVLLETKVLEIFPVILTTYFLIPNSFKHSLPGDRLCKYNVLSKQIMCS